MTHSTTPFFEEIFSYPIGEFKEHLLDGNNGRIIFSGKYGVGKTRFLQNFFKPENQRRHLGGEKYTEYRLSPVNYSISQTDDIIEYIKYDIIIEFLRKGVTIEKAVPGFLHTLPDFLKKNLDKVLAAFIYMIPKLGKEVYESWEKLNELKEEYLKYHDNATRQDDDMLIGQLTRIEAKTGSLYANDAVTAIIKKVVNRDEQHAILILDDLDRLATLQRG